MFGRLSSIPEYIGYILALLVKYIEVGFDITCLFISGVELLLQLLGAAELIKALLGLKEYCKFEFFLYYILNYY